MSKRLQVLLEEREFDDIRDIARRHRMTMAEWVRQALRSARGREDGSRVEQKLDALRIAVQHDFPVAEIEQILEEIEHGYLNRMLV
ncbi:MAG: hypothetical protein ACREUI_09400 [Burkholderiales bacterium]